MNRRQLPHLVVKGFFQPEKYTAARRGNAAIDLPARDRTEHGTSVREQLEKLRTEKIPVSLFAPVDIDLYTPVDTAIKAAIKQPIPIEIPKGGP